MSYLRHWNSVAWMTSLIQTAVTNLLFDSCGQLKNNRDWMNKYIDLFLSSPSVSFFFLFSSACSSPPWPIAFPHSSRTIGWVTLISFCFCRCSMQGAVRTAHYTATNATTNSEQWEGNGHSLSLGTTKGFSDRRDSFKQNCQYTSLELNPIPRKCGPGSSVGIAIDYGLDGPASNPGGDEIFRPSRPALGPT